MTMTRTRSIGQTRFGIENASGGVEVSFPMDPIKSIKLRWLQGALHDISYELSRSQFYRFGRQAWQPANKPYRCDTCIRICVDLAGVDSSLIDLSVEPRRLVIGGTREFAVPTGDEGCAQQLLSM